MLRIATKVFDLVDRIAGAATPADTWTEYLAAARAAGFEYGVVFLAIGDAELSKRCYTDNMPDGWLGAYAAQNCGRIDPVAARTLQAASPFEFHTADWHGDDTRRAWHDLDRDAGIEQGLVIPYRANGTVRAIGVSGGEIALHPHDRKALEFAGLETLMRLRTLGAQPLEMSGLLLSARERECLQWIAAGKSDWEIGEILTLSDKTVNAYVERAKGKLQATTRTQAIVTALRCGAINP